MVDLTYKTLEMKSSGHMDGHRPPVCCVVYTLQHTIVIILWKIEELHLV